MTTKATSLITGLIFCLALIAALPADAQTSTDPTWNDAVSRHHQLQQQMMNEMSREMARLTEQMSRGALSPEDNRKMSQQMNRMAKIMRFMSGLGARPAHNHAQLQKQMDQMRTRMKEMIGNSQSPGAR